MLCLLSPMLTIKHILFVQQVRTKRTTTETDRKLVKWDDSGLIMTPRKKKNSYHWNCIQSSSWTKLSGAAGNFRKIPAIPEFIHPSILGPAVAQEVWPFLLQSACFCGWDIDRWDRKCRDALVWVNEAFGINSCDCRGRREEPFIYHVIHPSIHPSCVSHSGSNTSIVI